MKNYLMPSMTKAPRSLSIPAFFTYIYLLSGPVHLFTHVIKPSSLVFTCNQAFFHLHGITCKQFFYFAITFFHAKALAICTNFSAWIYVQCQKMQTQALMSDGRVHGWDVYRSKPKPNESISEMHEVCVANIVSFGSMSCFLSVNVLWVGQLYIMRLS